MEDAAEAYNGARYRLSLIQDRIAKNRRLLSAAKRDLEAKREVLADRLVNLYVTPDPSLVNVLVSSGSVTGAVDAVELLDAVGQQDASIVQTLNETRDRLQRLRAELLSDRESAQDEVAAAERQRQRVEALLAQRQAVLDSAEGELGRLLAAERERERRAAAAAAELARQRMAATATAGSSAGGSTGSTTQVAPQATPAAPAPSAATTGAPAPAPSPAGAAMPQPPASR